MYPFFKNCSAWDDLLLRDFKCTMFGTAACSKTSGLLAKVINKILESSELFHI